MGFVGIVGIAFIFSLVVPGIQKDTTNSDIEIDDISIGVAYSETGRSEDIEPGQPHPEYSTFPPTSGYHHPFWARWGIHDGAVADETQIHNLEHGGIVIQYSIEDEQIITDIEDFAKGQPLYPACLLVAPYPQMDYRIALTAWGVMLTMDQYDEEEMQSFLDAYRILTVYQTTDSAGLPATGVANLRGPERTDCKLNSGYMQ